MNPIRILIADDDAGMRLVMRRLVQRAEGYELAGEAADGDELLALYERENPDVVLIDVEMPGKTGVECAKIIQDRNPRTVLVFATAHEQYMGLSLIHISTFRQNIFPDCCNTGRSSSVITRMDAP